MTHKFRDLVGVLKDKASFALTALVSPPTPSGHPPVPPDLAVLRATSHFPSTLPPDPRHIESLLSFGSSSRLAASALVSALALRLSSARDPVVALKSLLSLHHLLRNASFILLDTVYSSFLPSSGRRNSLNLSSFRSPSSLPLSSWVRYYARLLELLLIAKPISNDRSEGDHNHNQDEMLVSLLNKDLLKELDILVAVAEEIGRMPPILTLERNMLVLEVARMVEQERMNVLHGVIARVREVKERLGDLGFADSVELVCLVRRLEDCWRNGGKAEESFLIEVKEVRERVGEVVVEEKGRIRREKAGESARIFDRSQGGLAEPVSFGSSRWLRI